MQSDRTSDANTVPFPPPDFVIFASSGLSHDGQVAGGISRDRDGQDKAKPRGSQQGTDCLQREGRRTRLPYVDWIGHLTRNDSEERSTENGDSEDE